MIVHMEKVENIDEGYCDRQGGGVVLFHNRGVFRGCTSLAVVPSLVDYFSPADAAAVLECHRAAASDTIGAVNRKKDRTEAG